MKYLQDVIIHLSLSYARLDSLKATTVELKRDRRFHPLLVKLFDNLSTHSSVQVRCNVTTLLGVRLQTIFQHSICNVALISVAHGGWSG